MSTNQIKRLRTLLKQTHTEPSWVRVKPVDRRKTADQLVGQLDWDGRDSPPAELTQRTRNDRDVILAPKQWAAAEWRVSDDKLRRKGMFTDEKPASSMTALEEENMLLRRQIEVMMGQVASGQHKLPQLNLGNIPRPPSGNAFVSNVFP